MKNLKKLLFGIVLLAVGIVVLLNALDVTDIDIFFPGWWTLVIIIPSVSGIITDRDKSGSIIGLLIGVALLLWQLDVIQLDLFLKLLAPVIIILIALKLIFGGIGRKKDTKVIVVNGELSEGTAIFGGKELNFDGQVFEGAEFTAIFGGVDCDLSGAIIERDCTIKATAIFGGIDIILPKGVNLKVNSTNIFGGTDDKYEKTPDTSVTVYVEAVSIFGGVEVK